MPVSSSSVDTSFPLSDGPGFQATKRREAYSSTSTTTGEALSHLQRAASGAVRRVPGTRIQEGACRPRIALLEFGGLPPAILDDATEYARAVAADLAVPAMASPWRLLALRYSSEAAGDDWSNGRWAADVSWRQLFSYAL